MTALRCAGGVTVGNADIANELSCQFMAQNAQGWRPCPVGERRFTDSRYGAAWTTRTMDRPVRNGGFPLVFASTASPPAALAGSQSKARGVAIS
jgi:hypothetical protein